MSEPTRRFFSAPSLSQAVAAAARHHGIDPAELDYRVRDRRHGFVRAPRGVVIEVDPTAPRRAPGAPPPQAVSPAPAPRGDVPPRPAGERAPSTRREPRHEPRPGPRGEPRSEPRRGRPAPGAEPESWAAPDADSELAALEAAGRLLRLAGLEVTAHVRRDEERLEVTLAGADEPRLAELGNDFLDQLEQLMPRAVHGLCGRLVRVRVDGAGLRGAREQELRALARRAAERVLAGTVDEELLAPLAPAERRIVHLELADRDGITTESLGDGHLKRVRVSRSR